MVCNFAVAHLQPAQWGASLDEQHRRLGGQLGSLRELVVSGAQDQLLSAVGAVASAAPSLACLEIHITDSLSRVEVSPICSASLESISVAGACYYRPALVPPQVLLTFLPGCARLREVHVQVVGFEGKPARGAAVKIRCHRCSQRCIVPVDGNANGNNKVPGEVCAGAVDDVVVNFLHTPSSEQDVQECTVLYAWHAAGPEQAPLWGRAVMPGIL